MMFRKFTAAVAVAMLIVAPALAAKEQEAVKVTSPNNLIGTQKVTIGQFTIGFLIERRDSAKAGGGLMGSGFGGRSTVRSTLAGYTPEELQQLADAAYTDFVAKLTASGFEVTDRAALAAFPEIAGLASEPGPKEVTTVTGRDDKAKVLLVSASQTAPLRLLPGDYQPSGFGGIGMALAGIKSITALANFAKESSTRIVNVVYYIDFADSDEYGGAWTSSSSVRVNGSLALLPNQSKLSVLSGDTKSGVLVLNKPVAVGGDFFDKADAMGGTEKAANALGNVIGLLGGVGTNSSKKFTFTARPGAYAAGVTQATGEANTLLTEKLATLR